MDRRTVLLTGASGLVGTWLRRTAPAGVTVVPLVHRRPTGARPELTADLRVAGQVDAAVAAARPDLVVHAAYAKERDSIVAATANVARASGAVGAGLVHLSTDAVFSGDGRPRAETDVPDPVSDYGRWKTEAERIAAGEGAAVVRLPLVTSLDPPDDAVVKIGRGAESGQPTTWWHDEIRQPAMAAELARALWSIAALEAGARTGVWHLPGPERLSRAAIAERVREALGLEPSCIRVEASPAGDARPRDLWLRSDRAARTIGWDPSPVLVP